ncbi:efflux RND transporter periplasmic adaptor subunit [Actinoplanes couchii]|uniref:Multidrug resistance protein MdtA-like C-terminal permuted SH3 domain-containing protein n=1 Tax=Actinoplanes couchii TaxID=403638 RepID=A0ABQ3XMI6_9ACTN|nr:efflux RND transporter periplasmic adaptor subunit [Actinoplanes couchii]MDR6321609.1 HlyD family secretion protein [Actinoplanes couchii]GID59704.1 hypothetical protein Aco03nite_081080 [Actinoplanes couchii]
MSDESDDRRRDRRVRWIGAGFVVLAAVSGGVILALGQQRQVPVSAVVVAVADRGAVTLDVATTGTVEPATTRTLAFGVNGTVATVPVRAGNRVVKGQTLATLDGTDVTDAVSDANAQLTEARARLGTATAADVRATASAATCARPARTAATPAAIPAATPAVAATDAVITDDVIILSTPAPESAGATATESASATATESADEIMPRPAGRRAAATPCATQGFPARGNDGILAAEQQINRAARAVEQATKAKSGATITAPIAGTVVAVSGSVGDQVRGGSGFVSLADTYTMQVRAEFPEADAGALTPGQSATITLADSDVIRSGRVVQVDPVGTSDGTLVRYGVLVSFAESPSDLLLGQSAQVKVRTGEVAAALRVPSTAVHDVSSGAGTVLLRSGSRSSERLVTVGLRGDQYTEILDGLAEGDRVVRSW